MRLGLPFVDADDEIEHAAGCTIGEFFEKYGEAEFRAGERRVIARLLDEPPHVLSTGGGAYMDAETRALMRAKAVTVWLRADLDVLFDRVRQARPPAAACARATPGRFSARLMTQRYPDLRRGRHRRRFDRPARRPHDRPGDRGAARLSAGPADGNAGMNAHLNASRTVRVDLAGRGYDIAIGPGLIDRAGALSAGLLAAPRVTIVSDETVAPLYGARLAASFARPASTPAWSPCRPARAARSSPPSAA